MESPTLTITKEEMRSGCAGFEESPASLAYAGRPLNLKSLKSRLSQLTKWRLSESDFRFLATNCSLTALGFNDGATGALIPHIQAYYNISYGIVSLLFIGQFVGNLTGAQLSVILTKKLGIGKLFAIAALVQAFGYIFIAARLPFPVMVIAFGISGFGITIQDALGNQHTAGLPKVDFKMGVLHCMYGFGAFLSPLIATVFVNTGHRWNLFYLIGLAFCIINFGLLAWSFKFEAEFEAISAEDSNAVELPTRERDLTEAESPSITPAQVDPVSSTPRRLQQHVSVLKAIKLRAVYTGVLMFFFYVGAEVAQAGWIVSYLIQFRDASSSAGYVSSGYFGGLALSRILMVPFNAWVGEQNVLYIYFAICVAMEFVVWYADSFIGNAIAVAIVGFAMGPMYPCAMATISKLLPRSYHTASIGLMASFGCVGSAVVPFWVGAMSQRYTTKVLQPFMIACFVAMTVCWAFVPRLRKSTE